MFDPTAFDNMKVVIEGVLYDRDLSGEIIIVDRNDWMNMAKMSRRFIITFALPDEQAGNMTASFEMEVKLANLVAELLPESISESLAGCHVKLNFSFKADLPIQTHQVIKERLIEIWGDNRHISTVVQKDPLEDSSETSNLVTINFARIIHEEQLDDLVEMTDVMVKTLAELRSFIKK